ncbi:MAG: 2-amino-4-hydroxy-6-hydroxymethyldihydropteridine diphosphokinase [Propionibacteriaceae bacterium]|nr:2-amino-4-hydroxy-6-hydroxymethyldihydropteridine diphosphokinase [Propionibacteriaceae bacterium]
MAGRLAASAALPAGRERIELTGLEAWGRHGVFDFEKAAPQLFRVDVQADLAPVPDRPDDLAATVDYGRVSRAVAEVVAGPPCELVETLAEHVAGAVLGLGGLAAVAVTVHKPQAPLPEPFADVAVTVRREAPRPRRRVVVSAGSNLDDRLALLQFGVAALATTPGLAATAVSGVYETAPVGAEGQSDYLNLVFVGESDLPAEALLERCLAIEHAAGRRRGHSAGPAPRRLDLDLIAVGDERAATDRLTLPHPRAGQRAFVLVPWLEADPAARLDGRPLAAWLAETAGQTVRRRDDLAVVGVRPAPTGGTGRA